MNLSPAQVLIDAQKAVPAVRYAAGVAGIAAVVAIVAGFRLDPRIAVFGTIIVLGLMFVLVVFSALVAHAGPALVNLALVAAWCFLLLTVATSAMLMTSYFFAWPKSIGSYLPPPTPEVLNFDTENTYSDPETPIDAGAYLGAFGIELENKTAGTRVVLINHLGSYGGKAFLPVSRPNVLTQMGSIDPVTFTLIFSRPLSRLSFVMPPLIAAAESGITFPKWRAYGLDAQGVEIASVGSDQFGSHIHTDSRTFTLPAPGSGVCIKAVRFDSDSERHAAFAAILIDDLALWYAPSNQCQ
ncbi:MAG TPA: hypothetical protein VEX86_06010 [Longimicrobium sp.]|nr:hypothetical protein [Longimicrobium sp.]